MSDLRTAALRARYALALWSTGRDMDAVALNDLIAELDAALAEPQEPAIPWGKAIGVEQKRGCRVCGIGADGKAFGYVCSRSDCPTRITCGGTV